MEAFVRLPRIFDGGYSVPQIPVPQVPANTCRKYLTTNPPYLPYDVPVYPGAL
jgi:hypothetical protein